MKLNSLGTVVDKTIFLGGGSEVRGTQSDEQTYYFEAGLSKESFFFLVCTHFPPEQLCNWPRSSCDAEPLPSGGSWCAPAPAPQSCMAYFRHVISYFIVIMCPVNKLSMWKNHIFSKHFQKGLNALKWKKWSYSVFAVLEASCPLLRNTLLEFIWEILRRLALEFNLPLLRRTLPDLWAGWGTGLLK